ncbi:hypothetical protein [Nonomuraea dietziae]|uniref:hypothetical protein n=1 Tax=Nonomuraea dietziae TaxID=65515 RepID=UPI00341E15BA
MAEEPQAQDDMLFAGLLTCGGVAGLHTEAASGVTLFICTAEDCGLVRVAAALLEQTISRRVFEQLRTPELMGDMVLATAGWQGGFDSLETWWTGAAPTAQREVLELVLDHIVVLPTEPGGALEAGERLSMRYLPTSGSSSVTGIACQAGARP